MPPLILSASGMRQYNTCPKAYDWYTKRTYWKPSEAMEIGRMAHQSIELGMMPIVATTDDADELARVNIANAMVAHFEAHYSQFFQNAVHEVEFWAVLRKDSLKIVQKPKEDAKGVFIHGILDAISVVKTSADWKLVIHELKTIGDASFEVKHTEFMDSVQLMLYRMLAEAISAKIKKPVGFRQTILRRKIPSTLHLNACSCTRRKAGTDPNCETCQGTGYSAISKAASEATPEHWDQVLAQFPHLATEDALARAQEARLKDLYGSTQYLPAGLVALQSAQLDLLKTQIKATIRGIRKAQKTGIWAQNLFHCTECPHLAQCIHRIEPEPPEQAPQLTLTPERVSLTDALAWLEAKNEH